MPKLTDLELAEIALCLRMGAKRSREEAEAATTPQIRELRERTAEIREQLARRIENYRKGTGNG